MTMKDMGAVVLEVIFATIALTFGIALLIVLLSFALVIAFGVPVGIAFLLFAAARWLWLHA